VVYDVWGANNDSLNPRKPRVRVNSNLIFRTFQLAQNAPDVVSNMETSDLGTFACLRAVTVVDWVHENNRKLLRRKKWCIN